jgi:hypothetical protein
MPLNKLKFERKKLKTQIFRFSALVTDKLKKEEDE